jgi:hypothetical protein
MAEKRYNFYSYYDYLHNSDFVDRFKENFTFLKQVAKNKFENEKILSIRYVYEFVARSLCLFQYIPINKIDQNFNRAYGHNDLQKARLDSYFGTINLQNKSFQITQCEFILSLMYLLFWDKDNLAKFDAVIYFQNKNDESVNIPNFDYYQYKKRIYGYTDIAPRRFLIKTDKAKQPIDLNWVNLFYILTPKALLQHISMHISKQFKEFISFLETGNAPDEINKLLLINTNKILDFFKKQSKPNKTNETKKQNTISLKQYLNKNISKINEEPFEILAVIKGMADDVNKICQVYLEEKLLDQFDKNLGTKVVYEYQDKKFFKALNTYKLNFENLIEEDDLIVKENKNG